MPTYRESEMIGINVFLFERWEIMRMGLKTMLNDHVNIKLVVEVNNKAEAFVKLISIKPDVILMNTIGPIKVVINFTKWIKEKYPQVKNLILTLHNYESSLVKILKKGANGYVLKEDFRDQFINVIEKVNAKDERIKSEFASEVYEKDGPTESSVKTSISKREQDFLSLISISLTNNKMAKKLFTGVKTIEMKRKQLFNKTGTSNTATFVNFVIMDIFTNYIWVK
ncbi:MAG: response regulator transcription factor [Burkholderiales bacterium]|nr:response regulator transcription factor [Bacteroidia bacterium]